MSFVAPVALESNEDGYQPAIALSKSNSSLTSIGEVKNYITLKWDSPYMSDDRHTLIPAEELQHCCNYCVSVGAKTENFTANVSHTNISCSGFPPAINTESISTHLFWNKD